MLLETKERLVRPATKDDFTTIQKFAMAFAQTENCAVDVIRPEDPSFVAEINGNVIGAAVVNKRGEDWWLTLLYISGGHRLSGYGRALIEAVENFVGPGIEIKAKATIGTQTYFQHLDWRPIDFLVWGITT